MSRRATYPATLRVVVYFVLFAFVILALYPVLHTLVTSLKSAHEYIDNKLLWPKSSTIENYVRVIIAGNMLRYFLNNCIVMPLAMLLYLLVCLAAGFAFGRLRFPFRLPIFLFVLFLMIFPQMMLSLQIFQVCRSLHLVNSYLGVILAWVAYFAPFGAYIMTTYYSTVPIEIVESAKIDGANIWRIFLHLMIPIAMPMVGIIVIIGFQSMWNELPFSLLLLQKDTLRTITLGVAMMQGQYGLDDTVLTAAIMTASAVPFLLFLFFQKYIAMGSYAGAVKG
ncbi:MAG: carbohydrate ABC transporter permease [Spirochaetes bacterium]|nr:carbohydrate ABC transporter permease [Spirochaetota bacterium]